MKLFLTSLSRRCLAGLLATLSLGAAAQPAPADAAARATVTAAEYRLAAGDQIRITVFQNPDLSVETRLTEAGTITFPLIGTVNLRGLTTSQAERRIADVQDFLRDVRDALDA